MNKTIYSVLDQAYGLGDFIRGSINLAYLAKKNGVQFRMHLSNHPLHSFFVHVEPKTPSMIIYMHYGAQPQENLVKLVEQFARSNEEAMYVSTNLFYDKESIDEELKNDLNKMLDFHNQPMEVPLDHYDVLHIRTSDGNYIHFDRLVERVRALNLGPNTIVISSDYETKRKLHTMFGFHFLDTQPVHTALTHDTALLANTVKDYLLLSKSQRTYCFTFYAHGSGFSEHCSFLHNIPYTKEII